MASFKYFFYVCLLIAPTQASPAIAVINESKVDLSDTTVNIAPGQTAQITCTPGGSPLPSVQWRKYQGEFGKGTTQEGNTLIISDALTSDSGHYMCVGVVDRKIVASKYAYVEVKGEVRPKNVKLSLQQLTIKAGQNGSIDCIPEGTPVPQVQWRKAEGTLSDRATQVNNTLIITNAQASDAGYYACYAIVESTPVFNNYARILVEDVPTTTPPQPQIQTASSTVSVSENQIKIPRGGSYSVECKPEGTPLPHAQWTKAEGWFGEGTGQSGNALVINNAQDGDRGIYVCTAIVAGNAGRTAYLQVEIVDVTTATPAQPENQAGSPRVSVSENQIKVPRGGSYSVECKPEGTPLPQVRWTKAGGWFGAGTRQNGNVLEITDAEDNDRGDYVCTAVGAGTAGQTAYLQVEIVGEETTTIYRPNQLPKRLDVSVEEGQDKIISCDFETGDDQQVVTWSRLDQRPLPPNAQQSGRRLIFQRATQDDAAEYLCRVTNISGGGYVLRQLYLRLLVEAVRQTEAVQPRVVVNPETSRVARGQALVVECSVVAGDDVRVAWERVGGSFSSRAENRGEQLVFRSIEVEDGGSYRCVARNHAGETAQTTEIVVLDETTAPPQSQTQAGSPRVSVSENQIKIPRGGSYSVECKPEGTPLPRVQWTKAGGWFGAGTRQNGNVLEITEAEDNDRGDYVCTAVGAGTAGQTAYLRVEIEDVAATPPLQPQVQAGTPRVTVDETQIKIPRGGSYSVECKPEGTPLPRVQWTKAGGWFGAGTRQNGNVLEITDAEDNDRGDYVCTAVGAGTAGQTAYLQVEIEDVTAATSPQPQPQAGSPRVSVSENQIKIPRGGSYSVECKPEGTPLPRVQWTKAGGWFGAGTRQNGNALEITDAEDNDRGDYVCTAVGAGTAGQTAYLQVEIEESEPAIQYAVSSGVRVSESQVEIAKGGSKTVECYPEGEPLPSVQWAKESGPFASGTKQEGNALVITKAEEEDRGNYICSAVVDGDVVTADYLTVEVVENNEIDKSICSLPKETSWCLGERWYYDTAEHKCISFSWAGCPENANNFESEEACNLVCSGV